MVDERVAVNTSLTYRTPSRNEWNVGIAYSSEEDFSSKEVSLSYLHYLNSFKNSSISAGLSTQKNKSYFYLDDEWKDMDVLSSELSFTQIFTPKTLGQVTLFRTKHSGALTNPYQTVIRRVNEADIGDNPIYRFYRAREVRPDNKNISGIALNTISKVKEDLILHGSYRFYKDDWDISSHTMEVKAYYNIHKNIRLSPMLRYYTQSEASFFKDHREKDFIFAENGYASADDRLGSFHSTTYGFGIESDLNTKLNFSLDMAIQKTSYNLESKWISVGVNYVF